MRCIVHRFLIVSPVLWALTFQTAIADDSTKQLTPAQVVDMVKSLPPGTTIDIQTTDEAARGTGPGLEASGEKVDIDKFNASAPSASLGAGKAGASGGSLDASLSVLTKGGGGTIALIISGILCLLGAGFAGYLHLSRAAIIAGGLGVGLLVLAFYPALLLWGVALGAVGVLGFYLWAEHTGASTHEALRAVVAGVAAAPETAQKVVKDEIAKQADARDKAAISDIKVKDNL